MTTTEQYSPVEGYDANELKRLISESQSVFKPSIRINEYATVEQNKEGMKVLELQFGKTLFAAQVGQLGLSRDIEKESIRDFFSKNYDEESIHKVREKEHYLNIPLTGDPMKALGALSNFESRNKFNTLTLSHVTDATVSNMRRIHAAEREKNPEDELLAKRHAVEVALFQTNENEQLGLPLEKRKADIQDTIEKHIAFKEQETGKQLPLSRKPNINREITRFEDNLSLKSKMSGIKL